MTATVLKLDDSSLESGSYIEVFSGTHKDRSYLWVASVNSNHGDRYGFPSDEQARAYANLFAAAPKLLEALKGLTLLIANMRDVYGSKAADWLIEQEPYTKAQAAIAEAEAGAR